VRTMSVSAPSATYAARRNWVGVTLKRLRTRDEG
jgi:hypothetical protein